MKRQAESGRTLTIRINHNGSTALERSAINYWSACVCGGGGRLSPFYWGGGGECLNRFSFKSYVEKKLALGSAVVQKHMLLGPREGLLTHLCITIINI